MPTPTVSGNGVCISLVGGALDVLYIGIQNRMEIQLGGRSLEEVEIVCEGAGSELEIETEKLIHIRPKQEGKVKVVIREGDNERVFHFRALPFPSPTASFRPDKEETSGIMGNGTFKAKKGIVGALLNYDISITCPIQSFELTRIPRGGKPTKVTNEGGEYKGKAAKLVAAAQAGDVYYYTQIMGKCSHATTAQAIPPMVWEIR